MNEFESFEAYDVASWQASGVIKPILAPASPAQRQRRAKDFFVNIVASATIGLTVAGYSLVTVEAPATAALEWPTKPTAALTKQSLIEALRAVKSLNADWNGHAAPAAAQASVAAAERLLLELPDVVADVRAGIDDDGNVYFRLAQGEKVAYLTVEPDVLHLVCMTPNKGNVYVDDEHFRKKLPATIRKALTTTLA
jgi:hypothetical protein